MFCRHAIGDYGELLIEQVEVGAVTVDFDSTVITREGGPQGSAKGYNPNRKGEATQTIRSSPS
jgi:hypothetical protein